MGLRVGLNHHNELKFRDSFADSVNPSSDK